MAHTAGTCGDRSRPPHIGPTLSPNIAQVGPHTPFWVPLHSSPEYWRWLGASTSVKRPLVKGGAKDAVPTPDGAANAARQAPAPGPPVPAAGAEDAHRVAVEEQLGVVGGSAPRHLVKRRRSGSDRARSHQVIDQPRQVPCRDPLREILRRQPNATRSSATTSTWAGSWTVGVAYFLRRAPNFPTRHRTGLSMPVIPGWMDVAGEHRLGPESSRIAKRFAQGLADVVGAGGADRTGTPGCRARSG